MPRQSQFGFRESERGGSKLNSLLTILIVGGIIFLGVKLIPPYFAYYQFQDAIQTESKFALTGYPKRSMDQIQDEVFKKAQDLGIPAKRDDIKITQENGSVTIALDYTVPIDLMVYQFDWQFHPHADNHTI